MVAILIGHERDKVLPLILHTHHELTIASVIAGNSPGHVYVDHVITPQSGLVKTPVCNVLFGTLRNAEFNREITQHIEYLDQITGDHADWNEVIETHHRNRAIRKYQRRYYEIKRRHDHAPMDDNPVHEEFVYVSSLPSLRYNNTDIVTKWLEFEAIERFDGLCLAALVVIQNTIVSISAVDCFVDNRIEIGVNTLEGFRKNGYATIAVASLIAESFKNGIEQIGWHCVSTNRGSIKTAERCGLKHVLTYDSYSPYPPIENFDDLSTDQWREYAQFHEDKAVGDANQFWQAARCWAKARNLSKTLACIQKLLDHRIFWFIEYVSKCVEFSVFKDEPEWINMKERFTSIDTWRIPGKGLKRHFTGISLRCAP